MQRIKPIDITKGYVIINVVDSSGKSRKILVNKWEYIETVRYFYANSIGVHPCLVNLSLSEHYTKGLLLRDDEIIADLTNTNFLRICVAVLLSKY